MWHAVHNAGKRSVAIDTSSDAAWALVDAAVPGIDVVIGQLEPNAATAAVPRPAGERATIGTRSAATIVSAWSRSWSAAISHASR